ncbi:MAG: type I restriction-modification system subunit M [Treponema sp.]|jgi:type I restriction enzyme M protein|nr:type I restriction-modification system subunit M [Treponema sp.]
MGNENDIEQVMLKAGRMLAGATGERAVRDYLLPLFFVKYLSDFFLENGRETNGRIKPLFVMDEENSFPALFAQRDKPNLGECINKTLTNIETDNAQTLSGVLTLADYANAIILGGQEQRDKLLRGVLECMAPIDLRPLGRPHQPDVGRIFDSILEWFSLEGGAGKYTLSYTRPFVADLISSLAVLPEKAGSLPHIQEGGTIYDPACGSASLLVKIAKKIPGSSTGLYGQDISLSAISSAKMNVYLNGFPQAEIAQGDTIANPAFTVTGNKLKQFTVVISDIPLTIPNWKEGFRKTLLTGDEDISSMDPFRRFDYGVPSASMGAWVFLLHMIASCAPHGRVIATAPAGTLFRTASEHDIRRRLIGENLLDAVIALPRNSFLGTAVSGCILIFKKGRKEQDVLFIDSGDAKEPDMDAVISAYTKRADIKNYAHCASAAEIQHNDYNLSVQHYVNSETVKSAARNIREINRQIGHLKNEIETVNTEMETILRGLKIKGGNE